MYAVIGQLLYVVLIAVDIAESLEALFSLFVNIYFTTNSFNLLFRREKIKLVIELMKRITDEQIQQENCQKMITYSSRLTALLTCCHWFFISVATLFYMVIPIINFNKTGGNSDRPLPYNSWYPYDKNKSPNYEFSYMLEIFRGCGILNILTGNDCLLILIVSCTAGHFNVLREDFQNIYEQAKENVYEKCEEDVDIMNNEFYERVIAEEANKLLKKYIQRHIALLE